MPVRARAGESPPPRAVRASVVDEPCAIRRNLSDLVPKLVQSAVRSLGHAVSIVCPNEHRALGLAALPRQSPPFAGPAAAARIVGRLHPREALFPIDLPDCPRPPAEEEH